MFAPPARSSNRRYADTRSPPRAWRFAQERERLFPEDRDLLVAPPGRPRKPSCRSTGPSPRRGGHRGSLWLSPTAEELEAVFRRILEAMNARYVLRFEPAARRPGRHRLGVRLKGVEADVRARPAYFVPR
jgi:hypothetical protein